MRRRRALPWRNVLCAHFQAVEDLDDRVYKDPNSGCWLWLGATDHKGYGVVQCCGRRLRGNRLALLLTRGEVVALACHKCDTPLCVNPDHLYDGTVGQNARDAAARDRLYRQGSTLPRGIRFRPKECQRNPYRVELYTGGQRRHIGSYPTLAAAILARGKP